MSWREYGDLSEFIQQDPRSTLFRVSFCLALHPLLVGGFNTSEKYLSIGMIFPNTWEKNMFQTTNQTNMWRFYECHGASLNEHEEFNKCGC